MPFKGKQLICKCGHSITKHLRRYNVEGPNEYYNCRVKGCNCKLFSKKNKG